MVNAGPRSFALTAMAAALALSTPAFAQTTPPAAAPSGLQNQAPPPAQNQIGPLAETQNQTGAPPAAQGPSPEAVALAAEIQRASSCTPNRSLPDVRWSLRRQEDAVIAHALALVAASSSACAPVKAAAVRLQADYPLPAPPEPEPVVAEAAPPPAPLAVDPAAEARLTAEILRFTVGPPPRHMTKGRQAGG